MTKIVIFRRSRRFQHDTSSYRAVKILKQTSRLHTRIFAIVFASAI